jgi:group I intron endonuclease
LLIYKATNKINGKSYIGQTIYKLKRRKRRHVSDSLNNNNKNNYFHRALLKYGKNAFDWEVLSEGDFTIELLNELEIHFISLYNTYVNGYNLTRGGSGSSGRNLSKEARKKISERMMGKNNPMYGRFGEDNHRYGKKRSMETKMKISERMRGNNNPMYGRYGKKNSAAVPVIIDNKYFDTCKEAAEFLNVAPPTIGRRIKRQVPGYRYA